jgi:alanyl-tRNA synthetase
MTAQEIRRAYLEFFKDKDHVVIPRASLVPKEDPRVLFTGSGMQPMVPYLLGEEHPQGTRLADSQLCFRAQDIEDVGDDSHTTTFEMLGNWSLGDYFKKEQVPWIAEFIFDIVGLDPEKVYVTCYIGNETYNIPRDDEAIALWTEEFKKRGIDAKVVEIGSAENGDKVGMQGGRIFLYDGKENWWSRSGDEENTMVGDPCGPDSEMFFDFGEEHHDESVWGMPHPANESPRFIEIGNNVFMGYRKTDGGFELLEKPNIDHGSGLERLANASLGLQDMFKIDLLWPIIQKIEKLSKKKYDENKVEMQVIADHLKGAMFLAVDGVKPNNKEQGYVMRRMMRRAILKAFNLGIEQNFVQEVAPVIAELYRDDFPELLENEQDVIATLVKEEKAFKQTLRKGLREFEKMAGVRFSEEFDTGSPSDDPARTEKPRLNGEQLFKLHDTYGFPMELSKEEAQKRDFRIALNADEDFEMFMKEQRERSQTATKGAFKGGLGGQQLIHKKYHTATHLMYQALRDVLGGHVVQHGSNITEERLRFDFSHPEKVTPEQIAQIEAIVNEQIAQDLKVTWAEYPTEQATGELGALGQFGDRYGDTVKVYNMQADGAEKPFSFEICGGPHVDHSLQLFEDSKKFKITKEQSSSAGIRRIKATLV